MVGEPTRAIAYPKRGAPFVDFETASPERTAIKKAVNDKNNKYM
jgi:hypothetical protein